MYLIIDKFFDPITATIVVDEDGRNILFDSKEEAEKWAKNNVQDPVIVEV